MLMFPLIPIFFIIFIVFVLILIVRGLAGAFSNASGGGLASNPAVTTQLAEDGFWLTSCPADPLAVIHYQYWVAGVRRSGRIPFQPDAQGRQFVYTGDRPEQVSILRIVEQSDDLTPSILPPLIAAETSLWDSSSSSPSTPSSSSSGFPSAY